jgi:hypothetical protein
MIKVNIALFRKIKRTVLEINSIEIIKCVVFQKLRE